jgi:hypothetical protein
MGFGEHESSGEGRLGGCQVAVTLAPAQHLERLARYLGQAEAFRSFQRRHGQRSCLVGPAHDRRLSPDCVHPSGEALVWHLRRLGTRPLQQRARLVVAGRAQGGAGES